MRVQNVSAGGGAGGAVADRWFDELRAGRCFSQGGQIIGAAGQLAHAQLLNPVGSAVTVLVGAILLGSSAAQSSYITRYDTALTTLAGTGTNLLIGGAVGKGEVRTQSSVALLGAPQLGRVRLGGNTTYPMFFWFAELGPGNGLVIAAATVATVLDITFLWNEI